MRCTAASRFFPCASSSEAIRSSYPAADAQSGWSVCAKPMVASAWAFDNSAAFSAIHCSTCCKPGLTFPLPMFALLVLDRIAQGRAASRFFLMKVIRWRIESLACNTCTSSDSGPPSVSAQASFLVVLHLRQGRVKPDQGPRFLAGQPQHQVIVVGIALQRVVLVFGQRLHLRRRCERELAGLVRSEEH